MISNNLNAMNAYQNQLKIAKSALEGDTSGDTGSTGNTGSTGSFSAMLESNLQDMVNTQNVAENAKIEAITGKGDVTDLVTAIANAEMALNTIVTVRDRVISAYQDIIRMPI